MPAATQANSDHPKKKGIAIGVEQQSSPPENTNLEWHTKWTNAVRHIHKPIIQGLHAITQTAATHPRKMAIFMAVFAIGVMMMGVSTNFQMKDDDHIWTPNKSETLSHDKWVNNDSGFPESGRGIWLFFHQHGENVLGREQIEHVFKALEAIATLPNFASVCDKGEAGECLISGVTDFWNHSATVFDEEVSSDLETIAAMSAETYPDGSPVSENSILGKPTRDSSGLLTSAQGYLMVFELYDTDDAEDFEKDAIDAIVDLDDEWVAQSGGHPLLRVEVQATRSFGDEFSRALVRDLPLVPMVFVIMAIFTCGVFFQRDAVHSRTLLGFMAVVSVLLSIMSGYGLMFLCGVPFTSMTPILPFVIFGVGLDDAYILTGSFHRTDPKKQPKERIFDMIDDCGLSITLTTITSTLAFGLGSISTIPTVYWLCYYALTTLGFVFIYQLTFFVACLAMDEKRVQDGRRDCCTCCSVKRTQPESSDKNDLETEQGTGEQQVVARRSSTDQIMVWYAHQLMQPWVKLVVLVGFALLLVMAAVSTTELRQEFDMVDLVPSDSYVAHYYRASEEYTYRSEIAPGIYFRDVDQGDPSIQQQMEDFVQDIVAIDAVRFQPDVFWLWSFKEFLEQPEQQAVQDLTFNEQVDAFLANPVYYDLFNDHIVRNASGTVTASRCIVNMDNIDLDNVQSQIDALRDQKKVSQAQPINKGIDAAGMPFFTYDGYYNIWSFYETSVEELTLTTVYGTIAVTLVALILIPHWTAALYVFPLICVLYIDLLGLLQWAGVTVNVVSYIAMVMSIGLLVDFVMHILLRYYEMPGTREERTVEMLRTMGSSVMIGAASTLLGTMSLAFSSSEIFTTVFIAFVGLVSLGAAHGLILLPVVLSLIGPEDAIGGVSTATGRANKNAPAHMETEPEDVDVI